MSLEVKTTKGTVLCHLMLLGVNSVTIGEYEIPLDHFCEMAAHFLAGGIFGWGKEKTPECINWKEEETPECVSKALSFLFKLYKKEGERWVRKSAEELQKGTDPENKGGE